MNYTEKSKPGIGDPYWYEWSVGEQQILNMLNEDNNINYVELQANTGLGLDDVVVTYKDARVLCIQVKHTRVESTLTFADLVCSTERASKSLLAELADSWQKESEKYDEVIPQIFTNRRVGRVDSLTRGEVRFRRPALGHFWLELQKKIETAEKFKDIKFEEYTEAWEEWKSQLDGIQSDNNKLKFLKLLQLETEQKDLQEIEKDVLEHLSEAFKITLENADKLLGKLDHALRKWTTSQRESPRIYVEDVYEALSIDDYISPYNHELIPAEPFFNSREELIEKIEKELQYGVEKILFLSGIPGTGKTNIVSKLCNKRNSIIKIRYYAYEPIQPDKEYLPMDVSERVKKESFWNEMFSQLKQCLKGSLYKYNVPLQNCFMSWEQKKQLFFEIIDKYAKDIGCKFVIAIDGIDHAARAGIGEGTFLETLPNPEYIPDNIKLLISGQPPESYPSYPLWLRREGSDVKKICVPGIEKEDILSLVAKKISDDRRSEYNAIVDIVEKYSEKNTLAAIFAIYEASQCSSVLELEEKLSDRKLSGNIEEYYSNIWNDAISALKQYDFVDYKLAGIFAFFNERINGEILAEIFNELPIPSSEWNNVLKTLKPLIVEDAGKYHILHNDVKVFLLNILSTDVEHIQEIANTLVNYYLSTEDKSQAFYLDIVKLMIMAKRNEEIVDIFSSKFVIEAYVNGVELSELTTISSNILKDQLKQENVDYGKLQFLSTAILTIDRIKNTKDEIEDFDFRSAKPYVGVATYECYVEPMQNWNAHLVSDVLLYVKELFCSGKRERAIDLFNRWFENLSVVDLWNELKDNGMLDVRNDSWIALSAEAKQISEYLGKIICWSKQYSMISTGDTDDKGLTIFIRQLCEAFWYEIVSSYEDEELEEGLNSIKHLMISPDSLVHILIKLICDFKICSISIIERTTRSLFVNDKLGIVFNLFMRIVCGNVESCDPCEKKDLWSKIQDVQFSDRVSENDIYYYSMYAIIVSYFQPEKDEYIIASRLLNSFCEKNSTRDRAYYGAWFNSICYLGSWLYTKYNQESFVGRASKVEEILSILMVRDWSPAVWDLQTRSIYSLILKVYITLAMEESQEYQLAIFRVCEKIFQTNPVNQLMDAGWYFYRDNPERLIEWYQDWLGENGRAWNNYIGDRNKIVRDIFTLIDKYNMGCYIDTSEVKEKVKWSVIGYAYRKEYSLGDILAWYIELFEIDDDEAYMYTEQIKALSEKIDGLGDNRYAYEVDCRLYGDLFAQGLEAAQKILSTPVYMEELVKQPEYFIEGFIGALRIINVSKDELLAFWAFGLGLLNWKNEAHHSTIAALKRAIMLCAERNGIENIYEEICTMGKAEISVHPDPVRYIIPSRWCDERENKPVFESQCSYIEKYLKISKLDYSDRQMLIQECECLHGNEELYYCYLEKILENELRTEIYEWRGKDLLQYAIKNLPNTRADKYIKQYFLQRLEDDERPLFLEVNLNLLCLWKINQCGKEYCKQSLENLLDTHNLWVSSAGKINIKKDNVDESKDINLQLIYRLMDLENSHMYKELFIRILMVFMLSDNADTAENALRGIYNLLRLSPELVEWVEKLWDTLHYRAKEWILMIYELLATTSVEHKILLEDLIVGHTHDVDFNVVLYSRVILQTLYDKKGNELEKEKQEYFEDIPEYGIKKGIFTIKNSGPTLARTQYVTESLRRIEQELLDDCIDIERKVATYVERMKDLRNLLFAVGGEKQWSVALENINVAFLRVLYKEWYYGRWEDKEITLSQIILSATEPYILLQTPSIWPYQGHQVMSIRLDDFEAHTQKKQEEILKDIFNQGIGDSEIVLGGALMEYAYKKELIGFYTHYIENTRNFALNVCERNVNLLIHRSEELKENKHFHLFAHNVGIISFKESNIMCMFSKYALNIFRWKIVFDEGLKIVNDNNEAIGRFEYYYGFKKDMGDRLYMNQPIIQRWIITRNAFDEIQRVLGQDLKSAASAKILVNQ